MAHSLSPFCLQPHDHVYCSNDDMTTLDVHSKPRVRTTYPSFPDDISHITSNELLLQYCHVSVYIPFGLTFQLHSQTIWFTLSPSRHITYIRGIRAVLSTWYQLHGWS